MSHQSNGHAQSNGQTERKKPDAFRVEVRRIEVNEASFFRTLSESIGGLFVHYYSKNAQYCPGDSCAPHIHKVKPTWRGYVAAEEWIEPRQRWRPCVLEITEHCELDMRFVYARGQIWELTKPAVPEVKKPPVHAILSEQLDAESMPPAFDIKPVLMNLYHVFAIDLSKKNPLPPRVFAEESDGAAPQASKSGQAAAQPETFLSAEEAAARFQAAAKAQRERNRRNSRP